MFCDLVGSTALSARLDPEDLREILDAYRTCVAETAEGHDGFVAKYMGDGALVYFGYPHAHEDDAEQAVRAGLALIDAVDSLRLIPEGLQVRVGIATGLVIVGDLIGSGQASERGVVGETPNLAARLQAEAQPGTVVIDSNTRRLLGKLFECSDPGRLALKGFAGPVQAWTVMAENAVESRFEALRASQRPLIGRGDELALLLGRWRQARAGQGQAILVCGEPGIGKSRLVAALQGETENDAPVRLRYFCSPHHSQSALYPIMAQMERAAGFDREDTTERKLEKLEAVLRLSLPEGEDFALIAELLGLPTAGRYPPLDLSPQSRKERTHAALLRQLEGLAPRAPVLMVFEDAHWADPTSLEVLDRVIDRIRTLPVLLAVTFRLDFAPPWGTGAHVTSIRLNGLGQRDNIALVKHVAGDKPFPSELVEQIVAHTDGIPLFAEELTKTVLESGLLQEEGDRYLFTGSLRSMAVPSSLQASLVARLDRLTPGREVAQIGAVIGREFSYELLAAVTGLPHEAVRDGLAQLSGAELIFARGEPPDAVHSFKHALVQDAAYATLLKSRRAELHARIAQVLEIQYPDMSERQPEVLAHHYAGAGLPEKAIGFYLKAGGLALTRFAISEAIGQLRNGLEQVPKVADEATRGRLEIDLRLPLARALAAAKGFAAPETGHALARARELSERLNDVDWLYAVLSQQWGFLLVRGEVRAAVAAAEDLLHTAKARCDADGEMIGHLALGMGLLALGVPARARGHLEQAIALSERPGGACVWTVGLAAHVAAHAYLAFALAELGYLERAGVCCRRAVAEARELREPITVAFSLSVGSIPLAWSGDTRTFGEWTDELIGLADSQSLPFYQATGWILRGWLQAQSGGAEDGIRLARQGLDAFLATGQRYQFSITASLYAEVCEAAGDAACGLACIAEALSLAQATEEREHEAELLRLRGRLQLLEPGQDQGRDQQGQDCAMESFRQALGVAQAQHARFFELRAAKALAGLERARGRIGEARDLLAPVYGWFTEGLDLPDLKEAKALLDELAAANPGMTSQGSVSSGSCPRGPSA